MKNNIEKLVRKALTEAPIEYEPGYPERMSRGTERKFSSEEGLYSKNPAFRQGISAIEKLVSSRFKQVVDKLRGALNANQISQQVFMGAMSRMMGEVSNVVRIESAHRDELEKLAIQAALEATEVPEDWFDIQSRLNRGMIDVSDFRMKKEEIEQEEEEMLQTSFDVEEMTDEERLELEKHKRNIINAIVQGKAKKGHYVFELPGIKSKLDRISPSLYDAYKRIMATNDMLYFTMDEMIEMMSQTGQGVAGKVKIQSGGDDDEGEGEEGEEKSDVKIIADGMMFPILVHEIIKGIEEAKAKRGLPEDPELATKVMGQTDVLRHEPEQLMLGPAIVEKIRESMPDEVFEDKGLINWFEDELYSYEAKEFLNIIGDILSSSPSDNKRGKKKFEEILIQAKKNREEFEAPDEDDELDNLLGGLGISR